MKSIALTALLTAATALTAAAPVDSPDRLDYAIVVAGNELLEGAYADAHTCFLTRTLRPLGMHCTSATIIDDRREDIQETLRGLTGKVKLVIVTGGLGPTANDVTRDALSELTGIGLQEHPDVLQEMVRRFKTPAEQLRANLRRQARIPVGGTYLKNAEGTAVGLVFQKEDQVIVALPGPPRELQPMVRNELVPYLGRRFGIRQPGASIKLRFVGLGQSQIDHTLKEHVRMPDDVITFSQFEGSRVDFTFVLPHDRPQDRTRLAEVKQQILTQLAEYVYADDDTSLEDHVAQLLARRGATVTLAEAGSGGALAAGLAAAASSREVLSGAYVAPSDDRLRLLLGIPDGQWPAASAERTKILAAAAARLTKSPWAIAVGPLQQDQTGDRYVQVALHRPDGEVEIEQLRMRGTGELARANLATQLLDRLRRRLR